MKIGLAGAIALLASTFGVSAQAFDHKGTELSFAANWHDDASGAPLNENRTLQFNGFSQFGLSNNLQVALSYGAATEKYEDEFYADNFMLGGHVFVEDEDGRLGGFAQIVHSPEFVRLTMVGLEGAKDFGRFDVEGFIGKTEFDGARFTSFGAAIGVDLNEKANAYLKVQRGTGASVNNFGLSTFGISYDLEAGASGIPVTLGAEASKFYSASGSGTWNQFSLLATVHFGAAAKSRFRQQYSMEGYYDSGPGPFIGGPV